MPLCQEGALIARLPVQVNLNGKAASIRKLCLCPSQQSLPSHRCDAVASEDVDVKLSDLRNGRQLLPRRPVTASVI